MEDIIMPFGPSGIKVGALTAATPTPYDDAVLKKQLGAVGLDCAQLTKGFLSQQVEEVTSQLANGSVQAYAIKAPTSQVSMGRFSASSSAVAETSEPHSLTDVATANWTINAEGDGYGPQLEIIQYPTHFDWLYNNKANNGFTGVKDDQPAISGNYENAAAIQKLFITTALAASATLVKGLDKDAMKAALTNVIAPLANANLSNYNMPASGDPRPSLVIYLVDNYNTSTKEADGLGVLYFNWSLSISDYKRKTKDGGDTHATTLQVNAGSVLYGDPGPLCSDYNSVVKQFELSNAPSCS